MIFFERSPLATATVDFGDVPDLRCEVAGHFVDAFRQLFPHAADAFDLGLTAEFAFRADLARHTRDFRGERTQLLHHHVDGFLQLKNFTAHVHRNLA